MKAKLIRLAILVIGCALLAAGLRLLYLKYYPDSPPGTSPISVRITRTSGDQGRLGALGDGGMKAGSVGQSSEDEEGSSVVRGATPPSSILLITTAKLPMGVVGGSYRQILKTSTPAGKAIWKLAVGSLPPGLSFGRDGVLSGLPEKEGEWRFTVLVEDEKGRRARKEFRLLIRPSAEDKEEDALALLTTTLSDGFLGREYLQKIEWEGGEPPYEWALSGGLLPELIHLNKQTGVLYGTPREIGKFQFTIRLTDGAGKFVERNYTLLIQEGTIEIITDALPPAVIEEEYVFRFRATGGVVPYRWRFLAGTLPGGIEFDPDRGSLTGTPEKVEEAVFLIGVTDKKGRAAEKEFTLTVLEGAFKIRGQYSFRITTTTLPPATRGQLYAFCVEAEGGSLPYIWTVSQGDLPPSLSLESELGEINGVPEREGEAAFTVMASDRDGFTAEAYYLFSVSLQLVYLTTGTLPVGVVGDEYQASLEATGGTSPYEWSMESGTLPSGLELNASTGTIEGVISLSYLGEGTQEFVFRVKVWDQVGNYDIAELRLIVRETAEPTPIATPTPGEGEATISGVIGAAGDGKVGLAWNNPSSPFKKIEVRRKLGSYPENPYDGELVYRSTGDNFVDSSLENGTTYFYAVIVYDEGNLPSPVDEANRISLTPEKVSLFGANDPFADKVVGYHPLSGFGFGDTWVIGSSYNDEDKDVEKANMVALQKGANDTPSGSYILLDGGGEGRVESGSCESPDSSDGYCVKDLGNGIDGTFTIYSEYNSKPVYRNFNSTFYLFWSSYFDEDTYKTSRALGAPKGQGSYQGSYDVVSLQAKVEDGDPPCGGNIIIKFTDNIVVDGEGPDFTIFENVFYIGGSEQKRFMEPAIVYVSQDGVSYYRFPCNYVPHYDSQGNINYFNPYSYSCGFAGVNPVFSNNGSPDPTNPSVSGGDSFDLDDITGKDLTWIQYVRIKATGDNWLTDDDGDKIRHNQECGACSGIGSSGFDLDAVSAVNY